MWNNGTANHVYETISQQFCKIHRFKMIDDPTCLCKMSPQTTDHLLWECDLLKKQRQVLGNSITKAGGNWPITNSDLANKYTKFFQRFVNTINFEIL